MERLIDEIRGFVVNRSRTVIRICGHGGSGKTSFAQVLHQALPEGTSQVLDTDPYIILNRYSQDALLEYDFGGQRVQHAITACHPLRHELSSLRRDVTMLAQGMDVLTIDTPWSPAKCLKGSCPVTIVEGMTPTFLEADLFDLSLFFYTDDETELSRRLERDTTERGRDSDFVKRTHARRRQQYRLYMEPYKDDFDIIVNQSGNGFAVEKCVFPRSRKDDHG